MIPRVIITCLMLLCGSAAAQADIRVTTDTLRLEFSSAGQLNSAIACFPMCSGETAKIQQFGDAGVVEFGESGRSDWQLTEALTETHQELHFESPGGQVRHWKVPFHGYRLELELDGAKTLLLRSGESFRPRPAAGFGTWLEQSRYLVYQDGDVRPIGFDESEVTQLEASDWLGYRNRFWVMVMRPSVAVPIEVSTAEGRQDAEISVKQASAMSWSIYLGPIEPMVLSRAGSGLSDMLYAGLWFWLRWICFGLFHLLAWIKAVVPAWGLAVMILSLAVHVLMLPLSRIADRFQQQVNETEARLAPELNRIKKNYKGEEQAGKILALYKTERVHPLYSLKSMMGVAVVIPVFIGAFDMLAENIHLLNTGFLWISDLSRPDDLFRLPVQLPFFGSEFNLLPFLMTGLSVVASSLHNPLALDETLRKKQVRNMLLLAGAFFVLFYTFPAGMVLYWTTNNLISVIKSLWARR